MKNLYAILSALAFLLPMSLMAQTAAVQHEKCLAHHYYQQMMNNDPALGPLNNNWSKKRNRMQISRLQIEMPVPDKKTALLSE